VSAVTWPLSIFELEAGIGLAVCVQHKGRHIWHLDGCVGFGAERQPKALRVALTRQDRPPDPEPTEVVLDETKLAAGIALALDQLIQRRREARSSSAPQPPSEPTVPPNGSGILDRYRE
jgi:hypothetical protein